MAVEVTEGVVRLSGTADTKNHRDWAVHLANQTQDVVAVVDQLEIDDTWSLSPAWNEARTLVRGEHFEILDGRFGAASLDERFGYDPAWRR